jgi:hypothetical protein
VEKEPMETQQVSQSKSSSLYTVVHAALNTNIALNTSTILSLMPWWILSMPLKITKHIYLPCLYSGYRLYPLRLDDTLFLPSLTERSALKIMNLKIPPYKMIQTMVRNLEKY